MRKTLVIIRHAHRNKSQGRELDNGLNSQGRAQAKALAKYYKRAFGKSKAEVYSSPKKRCIETVERLADQARSELKILPDLDEGGSLPRKTSDLLKKWHASQAPITVYCTHGDWIPEFLRLVLGHALEIDKGGWVEFEQDEGREPNLRWIVQDPGR